MRSVFSSDFCLEPPPRSINYNPLYRPDLSPEVSSPSSTSTNSSFSLFLSYQPSPTAVNSAMLPTYQVSRSQHHGIYHQDRSTLKFPSTKMHTQSFSHTPTPQVPASQQYKLPPQVPASQQYKLPPQVPASQQYKLPPQVPESQQYKLPPQVPASQQYKLPPQVPFQLFNNSSVSCNLKLSMSPVRQGSYRMIKNICLFCKSNKESYRCYSSHALKDENGDVTCPILFKYVCPTCQATGKDAHTKAYCPLNPLKSFKPFRPWTRCNPI